MASNSYGARDARWNGAFQRRCTLPAYMAAPGETPFSFLPSPLREEEPTRAPLTLLITLPKRPFFFFLLPPPAPSTAPLRRLLGSNSGGSGVWPWCTKG